MSSLEYVIYNGIKHIIYSRKEGKIKIGVPKKCPCAAFWVKFPFENAV